MYWPQLPQWTAPATRMQTPDHLNWKAYCEDCRPDKTAKALELLKRCRVNGCQNEYGANGIVCGGCFYEYGTDTETNFASWIARKNAPPKQDWTADAKLGAVSKEAFGALRSAIAAKYSAPAAIDPRAVVIAAVEAAVAKCPPGLVPEAYRAALIAYTDEGRDASMVATMTKVCITGNSNVYNRAIAALSAPPQRRPAKWSGGRRWQR